MTERSLFPREAIQYHSNPRLCPNNLYWRSWCWMIPWWPKRPSRTNTPKMSFHHRGLECKSRKSRDTGSNRQLWPYSKWSGTKANRVMPRECTGFSKHCLSKTQDSTHRQNQMVNIEIRLIIFFAAENLYTVNKEEDWGQTLSQIMNSSLPNSGLTWRN